MATSIWYADTGGSDLNSGSSAATTADQSGSAGIVVTATLTEVGAFTAAAATGAINLQDGGNSEIRTYTKVGNDSITLDSAPAGGNGTYSWKIGGARTSIKKIVQTGTGENAKWAAGHTCYAKVGQTFTENVITPAATGIIRGNGGMATIDGTGGGAGSDILVLNAFRVMDIILANAVDQGIASSGGGVKILDNVRATVSGGIGLVATNASYCSARSCVGIGISIFASGARLTFCEAVDGTADGFNGAVNLAIVMVGCLAATNGGDGLDYNSNGASHTHIEGCTFDGNTGDAVKVTNQLAADATAVEAAMVNNIFSNNTGYPVDFVSAQTGTVYSDYNVRYANGHSNTDNNGVTAGGHDLTTDPQFTARASSDWSIKSTGSAYKTGLPVFKNPTLNALNIGAVAGTGSTETFIYTSAQSGGSRAHRR